MISKYVEKILNFYMGGRRTVYEVLGMTVIDKNIHPI